MIITFCGHNNVPNKNEVEQWLITVTKELIENGANTFYLGGYGDFDNLCLQVLSEHKKIYKNIELLLIIPYLNHNVSTTYYDGTIYPDLEKTPLKFAILKRNQWMVERADVVVSYVTYNFGGASKMLEYAKRKNKNIILYQKSVDE